MTYQSNVPQASDLISVSQNDILQNFQAIGTSWPVNHVDFNDVGAGKHNFVEMPNQGSDPAGAPTEMTFFSKLSSGGNSEVFYKRDAEATAYQLTGKNPTNAASGWSFLPGGLIIQWKFVASPSDSDVVTFPTAFGATPYSLQLTASRNGTSAGDVNATSVSSTQFTLRLGSNSNTGVWVLAIGPE